MPPNFEDESSLFRTKTEKLYIRIGGCGDADNEGGAEHDVE
jgi:hypothetical protein